MPKDGNNDQAAGPASTPTASKKVGRHKLVFIIAIWGLIFCLVRIAQSPTRSSLKSVMAAMKQLDFPDLSQAVESLALNSMIGGMTTETNNDNNKDDNDDDGDGYPVIGMDEKINVLILYPDDWRHDDLQDANPVIKTPTFSQLAKEGIRFTYNAVTTSICWISRATLFSGQYVSGHESSYLFRPVFASDPERWALSWPALLQKTGYFVGHIGKWQYHDRDNYMRKNFNWSNYFEGWIMKTESDGTRKYIADHAGNQAIRFLRERPKDIPFAATVAFYPPKGIFELDHCGPNYTALYHDVIHEEPYDRGMAYHRLPSFLQWNRTDARARYLYRYEQHGNYQNSTTAQYATISHLDKVCGDIIQELHRQGIYNKTMIIVTADNGEFHGRHALADKWYPYQESIRVPLIIKDPRMPKKKRGTLDDSFTLNIDLAETILGAAGLDAPKSMHGRDLGDLYLDKPKSKVPWRQEFYYEFPRISGAIPPSIALVRKEWKYINWWLHDTEEMFNLKDDPFELNDVVDNAELADLKQEMKLRLEELRHDNYWPRVPGTKCDPLWPARTDIASKPDCSGVFPDRCCNASVASR